jgi:hypothetical protein
MSCLPVLSATVRFAVSCLVAALICSIAPGMSQAQKKAPAKPAGKTAAEKAAEADVKFKEADALRQAYIALAGANHDYNGHRAKAMNHLQSAVKLLDQAVAKNGSAKAKGASAYEDAVTAAAKRAANGTQTIHEQQAVSDAQLNKAAQMLATVRPAVVQLKQKNVLGHVDNAIKEIGIALKIR